MLYLLKLFTLKYLFSSVVNGDYCWGDGLNTVYSIYHCVITLKLFHSSWLRSQLIKTCSCLKFHYFQTANLALGVFPSKQKAYLFQWKHQPDGLENALHEDGCAGCCSDSRGTKLPSWSSDAAACWWLPPCYHSLLSCQRTAEEFSSVYPLYITCLFSLKHPSSPSVRLHMSKVG